VPIAIANDGFSNDGSQAWLRGLEASQPASSSSLLDTAPFWGALARQGRDLLGYHCPVVDANIINQAGEESSWGECACDAEIR